MAVLGRLLVSSAERLDLPDLLSIDSYSEGDWKYFLQGIVGETTPYILSGFEIIDPQTAIGTQSCSVQIADSIVFYPGSAAGPFFVGLPAGNANSLPLIPELRQNAVNYVYLTFTTFNSSQDSRAFWDPDIDGGTGGEFTQNVNTESVLGCQVNVSVGSFPANTIPIAAVTMGPVVITAIEDCRDLMFRLGTGGVNPNPYNTFAWPSLPNSSFQRNEPPTTMLAGGINPFEGGDKNIVTLKQWMDAVMSKLKELGGTVHWYDDASTTSVISIFLDAIATVFKSKGEWIHDATTPGLMTWTEDIKIKLTEDPRTYILRAGNFTLANEQVAYLDLVRNQPINSLDQPVSWTNGQSYVNTVGGVVGLFANLNIGDWIKKVDDDLQLYLRVEQFYTGVNAGGSPTTGASAKSIGLSAVYAGSSSVDIARYDKGVYLSTDVIVSSRNNTALTAAGGNFDWLAIRSDTIENIASAVTTSMPGINITANDGAKALVTTASPHGLVNDDRVTITGSAHTGYNGTFVVEVASATTFYIGISTVYPDEIGVASAFYATITTAALYNALGTLQLESANHGLNTDDTVTISATTNYNGQYQVSVRSSTVYTIPIGATHATETSGLSDEAKVIVRADGSAFSLVQGQQGAISDQLSANIKAFLGMTSDSQLYPDYHIITGYNTLNGTENYNSLLSDNVTTRLSNLTAMMADKAQDKTVKYLPANLTTITNTTSGSAQQITFQGPGATLTLLQPGNQVVGGNAVVSLPSASPGISLLVNQSAYVSINRNAASTPSIVVANTAAIPVDENVFVIATRLSDTSVYVWDGFNVAAGSAVPVPGYDATIESQDRNLKLVRGGDWSFTSGGSTPVNLAAHYNAGAGEGDSISNTQWTGQLFTATSSGSISNITLYMYNVSGTATGNLTAQIFASSGGLPTGAALGTSDPVAASSIYSGGLLPFPAQVFTFSTPVAGIVSSTQYCLVLNSGSLSGSIFLMHAGDAVSGQNEIKSTNSGVSWTNVSPFNMNFSIDGTITTAATLAWSAQANIQIPGLAESVNVIPAGNVGFTADGQVAYVEVNRSGAGGNLTPVVAAISAVPVDTGAVIFARYTSPNVVVGNNSMLLIPGESKSLFAGVSDQNLALIGSSVTEATSNPGYAARGSVNRIELDTEGALDAIARHDKEFDKYLGMFRMIAKTAGTQTRVRITGSDRVTFTGETLTQQMSSLRVSFTGAEIDFATGHIFLGDATLPLSTDFTTALGINFTPTTISANNYLWYSVAAVPSGTNADNTINVQFNVIAGSASAASLALANKPPLAGLTMLGYVGVQDNGAGGSGTVHNLVQANIAQLGVGSGSGGGSGLVKVRLNDPVDTTLPTGSVVIDGLSVSAGDLVLFSNLSSGNNEVYKATGAGLSITGWQAQFLFSGSVSPSSGDTIMITAGTGFADTIGTFTGTTWSFNSKVRYFNGADYWEVSSLNSAVIADNQIAPATFASFAWAGSQNMIIDYSISRVSAKETGTITITTDGTNIGMATTNVNTTGSAGVTFLAAISGSNINLNYTSTNVGSAGQIKFVLRRWSDSAGGPGGIPSYSGGGGSSITGAGSTGQLAIWSSPSNISGNSNLNYDTTNNLLEIGSGANVVQTTAMQQVTLPSGVQTNSSVFSYSDAFTFAVIEYSVVEGSNYRIGTMLVTQDSVATVNVVDTFSEVGTGTGLSFASPGVTHSITGGNVNIKFSATSSNIGGTFKWSMRRWS